MDKTTKKNLIYFTIGGHPQYASLLEVCIQSILSKMTHKEMTHIMVMCSETYKPYIRHIKGIDHVWIVPDSKSGVQASMKKVLIHEYPSIYNYSKVLYLDADIVALNDVNKLFSLMDNENNDNLYVFEEHTKAEYHNERFWGFGNYTPQQLKQFESRKQGVFNCGHWGFQVSSTMLEHFACVTVMINEHIHNKKRNYFYEQSFMNVYFNSKALTKPIFNGYIYIPYLCDKQPFQEDKVVLVHVANALETPHEKLRAMQTWLRSAVV